MLMKRLESTALEIFCDILFNFLPENLAHSELSIYPELIKGTKLCFHVHISIISFPPI